MASSSSFSYRSRHWAAVRPTMGAIVRHWVGMILARWRSFSSSSRIHSVFLIEGSSHSYHLDLLCVYVCECVCIDVCVCVCVCVCV
jgi:hypothetical protein